MMKNLFAILMLVGFFGVFGAVSANAQADLSGKYVYEAKANDDQESESYESLFELTFELKSNNKLIFTKTKSEVKEFEKPGSWIWNKAKKLLTVTIPAKSGQEKVIVTFRLDGKNLKVVTVSPASAGNIGDVFTRL